MSVIPLAVALFIVSCCTIAVVLSGRRLFGAQGRLIAALREQIAVKDELIDAQDNLIGSLQKLADERGKTLALLRLGEKIT